MFHNLVIICPYSFIDKKCDDITFSNIRAVKAAADTFIMNWENNYITKFQWVPLQSKAILVDCRISGIEIGLMGVKYLRLHLKLYLWRSIVDVLCDLIV